MASKYYTEKTAKAAAKYIKKLDEIKIRVPKGDKEKYKEAAKASGKSMNQFIIDCIKKRM